MKKMKTRSGYIAYKATALETLQIGGQGICDECNTYSETGYLVPVLNHYQRPSCFKAWKKRVKYYPEDRYIEDRNAAWYEHRIPLDAEQ